MTRLFRYSVILMLGVATALPAFADCPYFRVKYKLLRCNEWKEAASSSAAPDPVEEDALPDEGPTAKVVCSCDYSLSGSDPRCDFDQTLEQSSIRGVEDVKRFCARGKSLCNEVCPRQLP